MVNINFYLSNYLDKKAQAQIICKVRNQIKRLPFKLQIMYWDYHKQECSKKYIHWFEVNSKLAELRVYLEKIFMQNPSANLIESVNEFFGTAQEIMTLESAYDIYLATKISSSSENYLRKLRYYKIDYLKAGILKIDVHKCDSRAFSALRQYLLSTNNNNTIERKLRAFKGFLHFIHDNIAEIDLSWLRKTDLVRSFETEMIALNENELLDVTNCDLQPELDHIRDVFLFACYTGARYSDIKNLKFSDIKNDIWFLRVVKTQSYIQIPLNEQARLICAKYAQFGSLQVNVLQYLNRSIKKICRIAGITEPVRKTNYLGGKRIDLTFGKCDLISMHTARRTFITIALTKGIPQQIVMKVSGHRDYNSFKKYIRFTDNVVLDTFKEYWK